MSVEKLLKYVQSDNIADMLSEDEVSQIVEDATHGYDIDEDSSCRWIETNKDAMKMMKVCTQKHRTKNYAHSQVIYPLLASANIQLASRLIPHLVRNDKVAECAVLGPDPEGIKALKAEQVSTFFSYDLLVDSDSWLKESHKLLGMVCAWGTAYRKLYFDENLDKVLSEVLSPEDVIINANTCSIEKARRITVRHYMTKNQITEYIRDGKFSDIDMDDLKEGKMEYSGTCEEDGEYDGDSNPVYEILEQFCYVDLDDDGYEEPYVVYFHRASEMMLGMYSGYDEEDIHVNEKGQVKKIIPRPYIVDYHCIDDPEGKFHSMGLNHLLYHQNKSITSILRQLIDSGTLANQQGGFTTKAFKTKKREIQQELGKFTQLEVPPNVDIRSQIIPLPFKEPSQVLFSLLGLLIDAGKETGFVTQSLVGDAQGQNVPATTMLAIIEQGTRAFKPMIQKMFSSLKKEFKMMFYMYGKFSTLDRFIRYRDLNIQISREIFDDRELDIMPVADPTQCSEAHKYIKIQALEQMLQSPMANVMNLHSAADRVLKDLQIERPEELIMPPQPPQPDAAAIEAQTKQQVAMAKLELDRAKEEREGVKLQIEMLKTQIKQNEALIKQQESDEKQRMMLAKSEKDQQEANVKERMATVAEDKVEVERERLELMATQQRNENRAKASE